MRFTSCSGRCRPPAATPPARATLLVANPRDRAPGSSGRSDLRPRIRSHERLLPEGERPRSFRRPPDRDDEGGRAGGEEDQVRVRRTDLGYGSAARLRLHDPAAEESLLSAAAAAAHLPRPEGRELYRAGRPG